MTTAKCKISLKGGAGVWNYWVSIDDRRLDFDQNGVAAPRLTLDTELYIRWLVKGDSGTGYTISITPSGDVTLVSVGTHPINRAISKRFNSSSGNLRFVLRS